MNRNFSIKSLTVCLFLLAHSIFAFSNNENTNNSLLEKANLLINSGKKIIKSGGDQELAKNNFSEARDIAIQIGNKSLEFKSYFGDGLIDYYIGNFEASYHLLDSILTLIPLSEKELIASFHQLLGNDLVYMGKYAQSYEHLLKALAYYNAQNDREKLAKLHFAIGNNFFYQNQYKLALLEFQDASKIWESLDYKKGIFQAISAIGSVYEHLSQIEQAIEYSERALVLAKELDSPADMAWTFFNIGAISITGGDLEKAISNLQAAQELAIKLDDKPLLGYTLESLTNVYIHRKEHALALKHLDKSYEIARENNDLANIPGIYELYSIIHYNKSDLKNYKIYIDKFIMLKDSLKNEELAQSMGSLKNDFENREFQRTKEIALLKKDAKIYEFKKLIWIGSTSFISIIFLLLFFFVRKNNKLVKDKNQLLLSSNQKILQQNEQIKASYKDLRQYARIISHDLKEPLRNISSFTTLLKRSLGDQIKINSREYMEFITSGVSQMNNLLSDLNTYANLDANKITSSQINCNEIIDRVQASLNAKNQQREVQISTSALPQIQMKENHFHKILHHLLDNAIKFNESSKPRIEVNCLTKEHQYIFSVKDNGIGIAPEFKEKIFIVFQRLNNRQDYSGSGIGLSTCKKIITDYGGDIWCNSIPGEGSTFYFSIPVTIPSAPAKVEPQLLEAIS